MVISAAIAVITPAIINGRDGEIPTVKAEIAGPMTKPKPNDAPIIPNPFALSSGLVVSEMTAVATEIFPAVNPSSARAKNKKKAVGAKACIKKEITVPIIEMIKRGLLPYLSDILPIIGVAKKAHIEKREKSKPF